MCFINTLSSAMQAIMGLMHGDVWGEKQKVVVAGPDSKLLWHLSFGANMNPKARFQFTTIRHVCALLHLSLPTSVKTDAEPLDLRRTGTGDGAASEAGAEQTVHGVQLHPRVHSQVQ